MTCKKGLHSEKVMMKIFGSIFIVLAVISLIFGQIWITPIIFTLGLGLLLREWKFRGNKSDLMDLNQEIEGKTNDEHLSATQQSVSFWNLPFSRMVVVIIIMMLAVIDAFVFRTPLVDRYNPIGSWQILMGPTLFYPLVFLPLLLAIGIIFHLIFSIRKITLNRSENSLTIRERGFFRLTNRINLEHVTDSHFRSNATGLKALWLIPWSIQIWGNFASAWHYFTNEYTFGSGLFIGPTYLAHSLIYLLILLLLIFDPEYELHWETSAQECYLRWYNRRFFNRIQYENMAPFLNKDTKALEKTELGRGYQKQMVYYLQLGIFLFILPFISIAIPILFNDIVRVIILWGAIASLGVALKDYGLKVPHLNRFKYFHFKSIGKNSQTDHRNLRHTSLELILYLSQSLQLLTIGIIITTKWRIYPIFTTNSWIIWCDLIVSTILGIFMVWLYLKQQWKALDESNLIVQFGGCILLGVGFLLSFLL